MMDREFKPPTSNLWSVLSLLAVLGWALPVQAQSEPALQFTSPTVFQVHPEVTMRPLGLPADQRLGGGNKNVSFRRLDRAAVCRRRSDVHGGGAGRGGAGVLFRVALRGRVGRGCRVGRPSVFRRCH